MAPRLKTLFAYFWPLFLSTALVLALVFLFAKTSPLPATDASLHKAGQSLLDYVAGHHEPPLDTLNKFD
ncbi:putative transmembrane protein [Sesbania bispinosa]|nr:putative transmembrane protein [Sesbania bispinosa]